MLEKKQSHSVYRNALLNTGKGFTLIEMMITIALLVILASIATLSLQGYTLNKNLRSAARDIESDISHYQQKASSENTRYRIIFTVDASNPSSYTIQQGDSTGSSFTTILTKSPSSFGADIRIISANFNGNQTVNFFTRGTASPGNVQLRNSKNSTATVRVNMTGRTYVEFSIQ